MQHKLRNLIKQTSRKLRKEQTESESIIWRVVRNRKLLGKKFLRQYPIVFEWNGKKRFFIADFYCHEAKLVIELDGPIHKNQKEYDNIRNYIIRCLGIKIIRFDNSMIEQDLESVIKKLKECLKFPLSFQERGAERSEAG